MKQIENINFDLSDFLEPSLFAKHFIFNYVDFLVATNPKEYTQRDEMLRQEVKKNIGSKFNFSILDYEEVEDINSIDIALNELALKSMIQILVFINLFN